LEGRMFAHVDVSITENETLDAWECIVTS
jgi:hypothetical protein